MYSRRTATCRASRKGHCAALAPLLAAEDVDANLANEKMQSPLHFAAFKKMPEAVEMLLAHRGINTLVLDRKGRTPAEDTSDEAIRAAIVAAQEQVLAAVPKAAMSV